jgi:Ser/Thr protein kinase RdoA (MazF antagonist)
MNQPDQTTTNLTQIISRFAIKGRAGAVAPHGSGHIHDTYRVKNAESDQPDYLLQRINHHVFKQVPGLMANIQFVTAHLRQKLAAIPGAQPEKEVLTLIPTHDQKTYFQDDAGNYWRMYYFLDNTNSYDQVENPEQAYEGGKAFGKFQALLSDLPVNQLHETIPDFHNVVNRLRLFRASLAADKVNRVSLVPDEIKFVLDRAETMSTIYHWGEKKELPLRITHNDTKFNNVLLNKADKAQCVIDLDTVMPGYVAYDFGDSIRTIINAAPEDEPDLEKIKLNIPLFEGFTRGFLSETINALTTNEIRSLVPGVLLLPYIMGLRFLTDYLDGDNYYKIHFPEHNLQRARAQFRLVEKLEAEQETLAHIIKQVTQSLKTADLSIQK